MNRREFLKGTAWMGAAAFVAGCRFDNILGAAKTGAPMQGFSLPPMKKHLATFSKVDPRLEILWENCGGFPFNAEDEEPEDETEATCRAMLAMPGRKTGFAYKWQLIQDWSRFAPQAGPYVLGRNAESVKALDRRVQGPLWTKMTREWLSEGDRAFRLTRMIQRDPNAGSLNVVVNLNEPVRLPTALCAELFWSSDEEWKTVLRRVLNRAWLMNDGAVQ